MKKITALALAVVMMLMTFAAALPVVAAENEAAANLQAAMNKGENVTLTGDVDLSDFAWTTISEYAGTLDGAGYTITVPADTPFIDKLSGTVKNVTFVGSQSFDQDDVSAKAPKSDLKFGALGGIANYAWGATMDNVTSYINTYVMSTAGFNFGGLVGCSWPAYEVDTIETVDPETEAKVITYEYKNVRDSSFKNCTVYGSAYISFSATIRSGIGGLVGFISSNTTIDQCAVYSAIVQNNSNGQVGGLVGAVYADDNRTDSNANPTPSNSNYSDFIWNSVVKNSIFAGSYTGHGKVDQSAALVGYARGLTLQNCIATGVWNSVGTGGTRHFLGYCNVSGAYQHVLVDGCASVADVYSGNGYSNQVSYLRGTEYTIKNCLTYGNQTYAFDADRKTEENCTKLDSADAVAEEFVKRNSGYFTFDIYGNVKLVRDNSSEYSVYIDSADDLLTLVPGRTYYLTKDIDLTGTGIGYLGFIDSTLYGDGYTINLDGKPLFLSVTRSKIDGLNLAGKVNVAASQEAYVGALACNTAEISLVEVTNKADVTVTYSVSKGGDIGGIIGKATVKLQLEGVFNYGTVTTAHTAKDGKASPDVGGLIGEWGLISVKDANYLKYCINYGTVAYFGDNGTNGGGNVGGLAGRIACNGTGTHDDDVSVYQCANKGDITGKITGERAGGLFGYHRDESIDLCYNTGKMLLISENTTYPHNRRFGFTGYTNTGNKSASSSTSITNSYVVTYDTVESCFGNGNAGGSVLSGNFISENVTDTKNANWGESGKYDPSATYTDADDLFTKLQANEATVNIFTPDDCNINRGYPIFIWESHVGEHEYETLYTEGGKNYVSTGKDLACDTYSKDRFSGFVQFAESDPSLARFIFAINEEELTNEEIESFDLTITVSDFSGEEKSYTVNSEDLIAYVQVVAAGETFYGDNAQMFGFVVDFGDYEPIYVETKIEIAGEMWYYGSYRF